MYLCYVDESGTSDIPGNTSHYVLAGLSIPIESWKACDNAIEIIKTKYDLSNKEIHTGWLIRPYYEQVKIPDFEKLNWMQRRSSVETFRKSELLRLQKSKKPSQYRQVKKNYRLTEPYIHLTFMERKKLINEIAECIAGWQFARLFAECIDKIYFDPRIAPQPIEEQAFEQIVSRFSQYLNIISATCGEKRYGMIIHDNNETVAKKHTTLMKKFLIRGTFWTKVDCLIETPLFVDSQLTSMIQIVDVCGYAIRRYLENNETVLFDNVYKRADRKDGKVVGIRHFTKPGCKCKICSSHNKK